MHVSFGTYRGERSQIPPRSGVADNGELSNIGAKNRTPVLREGRIGS